MLLRYQRGLFLPEHGTSTLEKAAREIAAEDLFLSVGKKLASLGTDLSPAQTSHTYAPTFIAKQPDAKGFKKAELASALQRLLAKGGIHVEILSPGTTRQKSVIRFWETEGR